MTHSPRRLNRPLTRRASRYGTRMLGGVRRPDPAAPILRAFRVAEALVRRNHVFTAQTLSKMVIKR